MREAMRMAFTLLAGLCIPAAILVFSAGALRYHRTRREDYRYDVEFDRARRSVIRLTLDTGMLLVGAMLLFMALARWYR